MTPPDPQARKLNVLRLSLHLSGAAARSSSGEQMETNVLQADQEADNGIRVLFNIMVAGEKVGLLEATPAELGLPLTLRQARQYQADESHFRIPDHIKTALKSVVPTDGEPLWLSLAQPYGYLPVVPWERLFHPLLPVPLLRLPYADVQPVVSRESLDVILCGSFPLAKQNWSPEMVIERFVGQMPTSLPLQTTFHVFADAAVQSVLRAYRDRFSSTYQIELYDPEKAADYAVPAQSNDPDAPGDRLENPWLLWMRDSLAGRSADVVHFVCHGFLGRGQGALALAQSPVRNDDQFLARFVGARQLATFLDQIGAWSVVFSSQPGNYSVSGLRFLQDKIARLRPGPVLLHDMEQEGNQRILDHSYHFLYGMEQVPAPISGAISLYCHPNLTKQELTLSDERFKQLMDEFTLASKLSRTLEGSENTPAWLAFTQRSLERSVARLRVEPRSDEEAAMQSGVKDALRFTADVFARHAVAWGKTLGKDYGTEPPTAIGKTIPGFVSKS